MVAITSSGPPLICAHRPLLPSSVASTPVTTSATPSASSSGELPRTIATTSGRHQLRGERQPDAAVGARDGDAQVFQGGWVVDGVNVEDAGVPVGYGPREARRLVGEGVAGGVRQGQDRPSDAGTAGGSTDEGRGRPGEGFL